MYVPTLVFRTHQFSCIHWMASWSLNCFSKSYSCSRTTETLRSSIFLCASEPVLLLCCLVNETGPVKEKPAKPVLQYWHPALIHYSLHLPMTYVRCAALKEISCVSNLQHTFKSYLRIIYLYKRVTLLHYGVGCKHFNTFKKSGHIEHLNTLKRTTIYS